MLKTMKKPLSKLEQEAKLLECESLYYQVPKPEFIPNRLYHFIRENNPKLIEEAIKTIKKEGLKNAKNPRNTTSFIDKKVQRPLGIYFWGQEIKEEAHIEVDINKLNLKQLYAFPHFIADTILDIDQNYQVPDEFWHKIKKIAVAIPFTEYLGQFQAEYIYTANIPTKLLEIK
ncbi:hypothetical protein [Orenia marismortui]|uniref:Uncharacterized protein n=1 Tax=Orenia marismortui TaxID=46469 RepID=A0A4R8H7U0_9FIRM|nr:hypothetical protein [Orenia marismortui]TDX51096.1 hypothetical protein C7959_11678 [Orenia marismortui]